MFCLEANGVEDWKKEEFFNNVLKSPLELTRIVAVNSGYFVQGADGNEYGPVDATTLRAWVDEQRVIRDTKVRNASNGMVLMASNMPELDGKFPAFVPQPSTQAPGPSIGGMHTSINHLPPTGSYMPTNMNAMKSDMKGEWTEFWILMGLSALTAVVGIFIGIFTLILGIYTIKRAWEAHETGEKGAILALIIAVICLCGSIAIRIFFRTSVFSR